MVNRRRLAPGFLLTVVGLVALIGPGVWALDEEGPGTAAPACWRAAITQQWINTELAGSVLRVAVRGRAGLPVVVRSIGDFRAIGYTHTKPEVGPFVAEFAPMSKGTYFIEPEGLGTSFEVWLDGKNYTQVDFWQQACTPTPTPSPRPPTTVPRSVATTAPRPTIAPTQRPQPTAGWRGQIVEREENPDGSVYWATIAVRVVGRPAGQEVVIRSGSWSTAQKTGTKPEHGPDACEFGGLQPATYTLSLTDLAGSFSVAVERGDFVLVEFRPVGMGAVTTRWVGSVVSNTSGSQKTEQLNSAIAVVVAGKPWHEVEIRSDGWSTTAKTGYKPEYGPDALEFGGLRAGTYTITPKDLGTSLQVAVDGKGFALVRFDPVTTVSWPTPVRAGTPQPTARPTEPPKGPSKTATPGPSPIPAGAGWSGRVVSNTSFQQVGTGVSSAIVVRVPQRPGTWVAITGGGGWNSSCVTGTKPEYGPSACEFGGLWPGTYTLRPEGADAEVEVQMDGLGMAIVEFVAP